nr:beta-ketoacyl synthase N-terminal-like domain-containing protein [Mycobacterium riyadhense]
MLCPTSSVNARLAVSCGLNALDRRGPKTQGWRTRDRAFLQSHDIAIIGLACRFPGASNPGEFWHLLRNGRDATSPASLRSSYRDSGRHCARNVEASERREGLIDNVADFDAEFFNISPREVRTMDPRQRLALELTWELLELSYVVPESVHGDRVAVCIGAMNDQSNLLPRFRPLTGCALALGPATLWTTPSY